MFVNFIFKCKKILPLIKIKYRTLCFKLLSRCGLLPNVVCEGRISVVQSLSVQGRGQIILGDGCSLGVYPSPNFYRGECYLEARSPESKLIIGDRVFINNNAIIIADKSTIHIGNDTLIGPNFTCFDSNFHPLSPSKRLSSEYSSRSVHIGENVFVGANVTILKGVTIGDNSVIAAGSVVTVDVPANVLYKKNSDVFFFDLPH